MTDASNDRIADADIWRSRWTRRISPSTEVAQSIRMVQPLFLVHGTSIAFECGATNELATISVYVLDASNNLIIVGFDDG